MGELPETRYAKNADGAYVAYQVMGEGPPDVALIMTWASHMDMSWEVPAFSRFFRKLSGFSRLIRFDVRGTGLSDPLEPHEEPSLERSAADLLAVLNAIGVERATLIGNNISGLPAIFFAATYPERTESLVLDGCYARLAYADDYPWGVPQHQLDQAIGAATDAVIHSDPSINLGFLAPAARRHDPEFVAGYTKVVRSILSPRASRTIAQLTCYADVRPLLPAIHAPTLVLYRRDDQFAGKPHAMYLAQHIPGSKLVDLPGRDNLTIISSPDAVLDEIQEFLTGTRGTPPADRVLATILFTDIVSSTEHASRLGDQRWGELLDRHDRTVRRQLERFRGREVHTTGDGFLATFDGPGRAITCAKAICEAAKALGLDVRIGVHTGEVDIRGNDVAGIAVHIGSRIADLADAGEVLVSSTVKDLVAGSAFEFTDRGEYQLKGVGGSWRLYSAAGG